MADQVTVTTSTETDVIEVEVSNEQGPQGDITPTLEALRDQVAADRVQTGLDRTATASERATAVAAANTAVSAANSAADDAQATAADRIATGQDRTQTGLDRVATGEDRATTQADRTQTGLDRTATGQDRAATQADRNQTGLDRTATGEDRTATGLDRSATGADRAQTGLDRVATGEDRAASAASAAAAAVSAAAAAGVILNQYRGGVAGASVPATVVGGVAGDYFDITTAGTSQGIAWSVGDVARYNGVSGSWTRIPGNAAIATLRPEISTREVAGYLWSDGVTSNRGIIQTPGPRGNLAGAPQASWVGWVSVPLTNPSNTCYIAAILNTAVFDSNNGTGLNISLNSSGQLFLVETNAGFINRRGHIVTGFRAAYAGQRIWLEARWTQGTAAPVLRVNGVVVGTVEQNNGTPPDWLNAGTSYNVHLTGSVWPAAPAPLGQWLNAHLTDAESEAWRLTGRPPAWVAEGGSQQNIILDPARNSFFTAAATDWTNWGGMAVTLDDANDRIVITGANPGAGSRLSNNAHYNRLTVNSGTIRYRVRGVVGGLVGNQALRIGSVSGGGFISGAVEGVHMSPPIPNGAFDTIVTSAVGFYPGTRIDGSGAVSVWFSSFEIFVVGALSIPDVLPIAAVGDGTVLGDNPGRLVGITPITTRKDWQLTARTATNGNEQILGGAFLDVNRDVLDSIEQTPESGTPTTTVGSASGGAQYKASGALAAGINTPALVTRKTASAGVWVGSNAATPIRTTLTGHSR